MDSHLKFQIDALGGLIATHELYALGVGRSEIREATKSGELIRIRQGWYSDRSLGTEAREATRVGGRLACASAAKYWGMWVPDFDELHLVVPRNACQLRTRANYRQRLSDDLAKDVHVHWGDLSLLPLNRISVSPLESLRQIARCQPAEFALVVAESAIHLRLVSLGQWENELPSVPRRLRSILATARAQSESGTESLFAHRMRSAAVSFSQQVPVAGVGRVDFLIGDRLVVEIDSRAHHSDPSKDRRRDAALSIRGYRTLRFTYHQIINDWPLVLAAVLAAISRGDHLVS